MHSNLLAVVTSTRGKVVDMCASVEADTRLEPLLFYVRGKKRCSRQKSSVLLPPPIFPLNCSPPQMGAPAKWLLSNAAATATILRNGPKLSSAPVSKAKWLGQPVANLPVWIVSTRSQVLSSSYLTPSGRKTQVDIRRTKNLSNKNPRKRLKHGFKIKKKPPPHTHQTCINGYWWG